MYMKPDQIVHAWYSFLKYLASLIEEKTRKAVLDFLIYDLDYLLKNKNVFGTISGNIMFGIKNILKLIQASTYTIFSKILYDDI